MTFLRQVFSNIFKIIVLYLKFAVLATALYTLLYCYLKYFDSSDCPANIADVGNESTTLVDSSSTTTTSTAPATSRHFDL